MKKRTKKQIEKILQISNDISEGETEFSKEDLICVIQFWRDELDRTRNTYQDRIGDIAEKLVGVTVALARSYNAP